LEWMRQACAAVAKLHAPRWPLLHRDIKPDNMLIDNSMQLRLCDFGLTQRRSQSAQASSIENWAGTRLYVSPEVEDKESKPTIHSDVYALAMTVLRVYAKMSDKQLKQLKNNSGAADDIFASFDDDFLPDKLKNCLKWCLDHNHAVRPSAQRMADTLTEVMGEVKNDQKTGPERCVQFVTKMPRLFVGFTGYCVLDIKNGNKEPGTTPILFHNHYGISGQWTIMQTKKDEKEKNNFFLIQNVNSKLYLVLRLHPPAKAKTLLEFFLVFFFFLCCCCCCC
jgi:serine/threonine protein kinase